MKKRILNFEFLRVYAIVTIIMLHYLSKGDLLVPVAQDMSSKNLILWLIEAFCIVTMNCYVLISGYFLIDVEWKAKRVIDLLLQVLFYSILVPAGLLLTGILKLSEISIYDVVHCVLPIGSECYWFMSAYFVVYLLAPILVKGIKALDKKQYQMILGMLLFLYVAEKTVVPLPFATDHYGYDFGWFIILFLVAAYIRLYGISFLEKKRNAWIIHIACCLLIWAGSLICVQLTKWTGLPTFVDYYTDILFTHNHIVCFLGSLSLFYICKNGSFGRADSLFAKMIYAMAPASLGVYLLHEHPLVRYRWPVWLGVSSERSAIGIILHMCMCVVILYVCGMLTEIVRKWVFRLAGKGRKKK